ASPLVQFLEAFQTGKIAASGQSLRQRVEIGAEVGKIVHFLMLTQAFRYRWVKQGEADSTGRAKERLFFLFFDGNRLQIFGFEDLTAIKAFYVLDPITSGNDLGPGVFTSELHKAR